MFQFTVDLLIVATVNCHAAGGPRRKWSGRTKHGAISGPPIEHGLSIRNIVMTVVLYNMA